jgi:hypothetical protein
MALFAFVLDGVIKKTGGSVMQETAATVNGIDILV